MTKPTKVDPVIKAHREARRVLNMKVKRGTARAKRRLNGNYMPVNEAASLKQHPDGGFARSIKERKAKLNMAAALAVPVA